MLNISNIKMHIDEKSTVKQYVCKLIKISEKDLISFSIIKESVDARKKDDIYFMYSINLELENEEKIFEKLSNKKMKINIKKAEKKEYEYVKKGLEPLNNRPVIVGAGPCGLFAGLILAEMGYRPILLERGKDVDSRTEDVKEFWNERKFNKDSNVQFGEGGAGTFSDGKLTTLIKDKFSRSKKVLEAMVEAGAKEEILYKNKPHIGTDMLKDVVKNLRNKIIKLGGEVKFSSKVTDIIIKDNRITGVEVNNDELINSDVVVMAIGHSARDTFKLINDRKIGIEQKAFSMGVRIEHKQSMIDNSQYGSYAGHEKLGAAEYKLAYHNENGRSAYTFCMCPGGEVVAAASEEGMVVTNGMSENARTKENANSAILVNVLPTDFESDHPLAGVEFQRKWEKKAFELAGSNYNAPAQLVGDFLNSNSSANVCEEQKDNQTRIVPSYRPEITFTDLTKCLPEYITQTMKEALVDFDKKIKGFANKEALMTGVETRSSSPVRILRDENFESINLKGLYPAGEGAGYAGGIMSASIDGIKVAEKIIEKYKEY